MALGAPGVDAVSGLISRYGRSRCRGLSLYERRTRVQGRAPTARAPGALATALVQRRPFAARGTRTVITSRRERPARQLAGRAEGAGRAGDAAGAACAARERDVPQRRQRPVASGAAAVAHTRDVAGAAPRVHLPRAAQRERQTGPQPMGAVAHVDEPADVAAPGANNRRCMRVIRIRPASPRWLVQVTLRPTLRRTSRLPMSSPLPAECTYMLAAGAPCGASAATPAASRRARQSEPMRGTLPCRSTSRLCLLGGGDMARQSRQHQRCLSRPGSPARTGSRRSRDRRARRPPTGLPGQFCSNFRGQPRRCRGPGC